MARAFVSVGSNIDAAAHVRRAIEMLAQKTRVAAISMVYLTDALGRPEQDPYYNCVVEIDTDVPPRVVKRSLLRPIEDQLGRERTEDKYAPRTIDLDLIAYGDAVLEADGIRLPDPDILERPFLAVPLCELAPGWVLPGSRRTIDEIAARLPLTGMRPLARYTAELRDSLAQRAHGLSRQGRHAREPRQ
jgi:2-amino-4-hydroxy-6-hydroxymethyldihydropteridine diphosphokinase